MKFVKGTVFLSGNGKKMLPSELDNLLEVACNYFGGSTVEFGTNGLSVFVGLQDAEDLIKFQQMRELLGNPPAKVGGFDVEEEDVLVKAKNAQPGNDFSIFLPRENNAGEKFSSEVYDDIIAFVNKELKRVPTIGTEKMLGAWRENGVIYYDEHQKLSSHTSDHSIVEKIAKYAGEKLDQLAMFIDFGDTFSIIDTDPAPYRG